MTKHLIQTLFHPFIWSWYYLFEDRDCIWMPEFPYGTEKYVWSFVKKFGYRLDDSTYKFCGIAYYHDITIQKEK